MERPNERLAYLLIKHLKDELTVEEQLELQEWVNISEHNQAIFHQLTDPDKLNEALKEHFSLETSIRDKIDAQMKTAALAEEAPAYYIRPRKRRRWMYVAAAAILLFLSITSYFWLASRFDSSSKARPASAPVAVRDVAPGGNKATLTLGNGSSIVLQDVTDGHLAEQGATQVSKEKNALSYTLAVSHSATPSTIVYNTLTTPRAGQFQVVLPDGTKVWLNNASSLRYPTSFSGSSREVELTGEGYFEVAKNTTQPFIVKVTDMTVQVLGTHFNIKAYQDENLESTTLLEGSVRVLKGSQKALLTPGDRAAFSSKDGLKLEQDVDVQEVISWKNGYFHFAGEGLPSVMAQLARWYDVSVEYKGTIPPQRFRGKIERTLPLSRVLQGLESDQIHFSIVDKKIIVTP